MNAPATHAERSTDVLTGLGQAIQTGDLVAVKEAWQTLTEAVVAANYYAAAAADAGSWDQCLEACGYELDTMIRANRHIGQSGQGRSAERMQMVAIWRHQPHLLLQAPLQVFYDLDWDMGYEDDSGTYISCATMPPCMKRAGLMTVSDVCAVLRAYIEGEDGGEQSALRTLCHTTPPNGVDAAASLLLWAANQRDDNGTWAIPLVAEGLTNPLPWASASGVLALVWARVFKAWIDRTMGIDLLSLHVNPDATA